MTISLERLLDGLEGVVVRDGHGFILTEPDLARFAGDGHRPRGWSLDRDLFWLEASVPGIVVAGDVRHGSVKRIAAGVGEGGDGRGLHSRVPPLELSRREADVLTSGPVIPEHA
jgi:hypothetical protein